MKPPKDHLVKRPFKYDPASNTDIRRRFERIRKERLEQPTPNVTPLSKVKK